MLYHATRATRLVSVAITCVFQDVEGDDPFQLNDRILVDMLMDVGELHSRIVRALGIYELRDSKPADTPVIIPEVVLTGGDVPLYVERLSVGVVFSCVCPDNIGVPEEYVRKRALGLTQYLNRHYSNDYVRLG